MAERINLTDTRIKTLAADLSSKRRPELRDSQVPGLIVIAHSSRKSFALHARFPGYRNPTRRHIGEVGALTIEQARQIARDWNDKIRRGVDPAVEVKKLEQQQRKQREAEELREEALFKTVAETYLTRRVANQRQHRSIERMVRNVLTPAWGNKPIAEIGRRDVVKLVEEINDRPAPMYAYTVFGCARTLFNWAINRGVYELENSPCDRIRVTDLMSQQKKPRQRVLKDDELVAFWKATGRIGYPWRDMFRLLLLTGTRRSEVAGARWSEFELDKGHWTIPPERFKSDVSHLVPLSRDAQALIAALPRFKRGDHLFSFTFGETPALILHSAKVRIDALMLRYLRALARQRGDDPAQVTLAPWVVHDLRRTVRTQLSKLKIDYTVRELCIGHSLKGLDRVYDQHPYIEEMRDAFDRWAVELRRIVAREQPVSNVVPLRGRGDTK
jgi:integrase